jgi:hypothetical protein
MNSPAILRIAGLDTSTYEVTLGRDPSAVAIVPVRLQKLTLESVDVSNTSELFDVISVPCRNYQCMVYPMIVTLPPR